jgi:membrane-bound lytic murein transglycosylase B
MRQQGIRKKFLKKVFNNKRLRKITLVVEKNVINKENKRNYDDFYSPYSIKVAYRFFRKWRTILSKASAKFRVDREVVVAICLVETGFGNMLGKYPLLSVFSTILVENQLRKRLLSSTINLTRVEADRLERLQEKAEWAEVELVAFLQIMYRTRSNPFQLKGSYAGAFGIPQFLPSSYLKWGYDSDGNGSVNLFHFPDAIYSVANYLKAHGWKKGLYRKTNHQVLWQYNHSDTYAKTVLTVAQKIQQYHHKRIHRKYSLDIR